MTTETIALLTILRDETQSRDVHARCVAEIGKLEFQQSMLSEAIVRIERQQKFQAVYPEYTKRTGVLTLRIK